MAFAGDIHVSSELGFLRRLIIHSPDGGIGKVVPAKFKEWLYDDTVHLTRMRRDYNAYVKILLYFLDREKIPYVESVEKSSREKRQFDCYKPDNPLYFNSSKVLDAQFLLSAILQENKVRQQVITAVCAWEGGGMHMEKTLDAVQEPAELAKLLISGIRIGSGKTDGFVFAPLPNLIFTRDIAVTINGQMLLGNAATAARERETLLMRFIAQYGLFPGKADEHLMEISEPGNFFLLSEEDQLRHKTSVEGGDVMMIAPNHLLVGCSERTTPGGVNEIIHALFRNNRAGIEKISVIRIPRHRSMMHIDTVFTQVRKDLWVLFGQFSERFLPSRFSARYSYFNRLQPEEERLPSFSVEILRFYKSLDEPYQADRNYRQDIGGRISGLESLLRDISTEDFGVAPGQVKFIYSGNNRFPYDEREQWTDSCNLLALKEGVVIGYDRNEETIKSFREQGFDIKTPEQLFAAFEKGLLPEEVENTLIILPSGELSRARGGAHCMSLPLLRDSLAGKR